MSKNVVIQKVKKIQHAKYQILKNIAKKAKIVAILHCSNLTQLILTLKHMNMIAPINLVVIIATFL